MIEALRAKHAMDERIRMERKLEEDNHPKLRDLAPQNACTGISRREFTVSIPSASPGQLAARQTLPPRHYGVLARCEELRRSTMRNDPFAWSRLTDSHGSDVDIFDYCFQKLMPKLENKGRKQWGRARWSWLTHLNTQTAMKFMLMNHGGCSEASQSRNVNDYMHTEMVSWWPVIALPIPGDDMWPMMCPALAESNAVPWVCHRSRLFLVPNEYRGPGTSNVLDTSEWQARQGGIPASSSASSSTSSSRIPIGTRSNDSSVCSLRNLIGDGNSRAASSTDGTFVVINGVEYVAVTAVSRLVQQDERRENASETSTEFDVIDNF